MKLHHFLLPFVVSAIFWVLVRVVFGWSGVWFCVIVCILAILVFYFINAKNKRSNI